MNNVDNALYTGEKENNIGGVRSIDYRPKHPEHTIQPHIQVQSFNVSITGPQQEKGSAVIDVMCPKQQDVVDVIVYYQDGSQIYICTDTRIRPVLSVRKEYIGEESDFRITDGLYTILADQKGDISFTDAVLRSIEERADIDYDEDTKIYIGSSYFPSIGASVEAAVPCYVCISKDKQSTIKKFGKGFDAEHKIDYQTPQRIVDNFFAGIVSDMRLVLHALELARKYNIPLSIPGKLQSIVGTNKYHQATSLSEDIILLAGNNAEDILANYYATQKTYNIVMEESESDPIFIHSGGITVTQNYVDGSYEEYDVDFAIRKGVDTIDVGSFFRHDSKLYIMTKMSTRPALEVRKRKPHHIVFSETTTNIEGFAGGAYGNILQGAKEIYNQKVGDFAITDQIVAGAYYPSPGNNPEKTYLVLQEMDPSRGNLANRKEFDVIQTPVMAIELDTLLQLFDKNVIKDPRLIIVANIVRQAAGYKNIIDAPIENINREDIDRFNMALNTPLEIDRFYKNSSTTLEDPSVYNLHILFKQNSPWYRKVMSYVEQELGGFFATNEILISETDQHFFDAAIPAFAVPSAELAEKYQNYATHDSGHFIQGTIIPYGDMSKEDYVRMMSKTEALAVFDSDYRYPKEVGLDIFEKTIGGHKSLVRSLENLDIVDPAQAKEVILSIEVDGVIPKYILQHKNYNQEKDIIVDRMLRFHFMDKIQAAAQYDQRMQNQEVMKVMLQFGNCTNDIHEFETRMASYEDVIAQHSEGVNSIKAYVNRIVTKYITLPAIKIGLIKQMLSDNGHDFNDKNIVLLDRRLNRLKLHRTQIATVASTITGIEANQKHIKAVRDADHIAGEVKKIVSLLDDYVVSSQYLTFDQRTRLLKNHISYFTGFAPMPDNISQLIHDCANEQENAIL